MNKEYKEGIDNRMHILFEKYVPMQGKCDSLAGEIIRAASRICYRFYNDGDMIGVGYGNETCNAAARFLKAKCPATISAMVAAIWGIHDDTAYDTILYCMLDMIATYVENNPKLEKEETEDMWDYQLKSDMDYEDEEWEDEDDEY